MESQYKQNIINSVSDLMQSLNSIENLSLDNVKDEQLIESFENIRGVIFKGISDIKHHIEILSTVAEWGRLNVSFFGETNAGKSTIIESLISGDGRSIGEGYKDFTKTVNKIAYKNINLMDMPGIEGREHKVIKNIHKAVNKSHVVFYVVGTNKEPEEQTISKIKKFLKDNVKVYSIINARGKPTIYKYKKELKDKNTLIVENRVREKFTDLLDGNYAGNVVVNGYLSLLKNNRLEQRFKNDREKAIGIFGDEHAIEKFSNIQDVNTIIDNLGNEIHDEIIISNTYKFLKSFGIILSKILREKKNFDSFIKETNNLTYKYLDDVEDIILKYESEIHASLDVNINRMRVELKKTISKVIDNGDSESSMKSKLDTVKQNQSKKLNEDITKLLSSMKDEIEGKIKEFKNRMSLQMRFLNLKGDFNLESILESLEISFKYVLGQIVDVGLSIWGVVVAFAINPILGVVAGVLALARKIWDWFFSDPDKRKREAKSQSTKKIDSLINDIEKKIRSDLQRELRKINSNTKKPVKQLQESMKGIKNISLSIDEKISEIKLSQTNMSLLLMKEFLGESIIFSYLDLQLSEAVVVGYSVNTKVKVHLKKKLRIKNINLYSSHTEWLNEVGSKNGADIFTAKNEFNFRAVSALSLHESNVFKFKRITRSKNI